MHWSLEVILSTVRLLSGGRGGGVHPDFFCET